MSRMTQKALRIILAFVFIVSGAGEIFIDKAISVKAETQEDLSLDTEDEHADDYCVEQTVTFEQEIDFAGSYRQALNVSEESLSLIEDASGMYGYNDLDKRSNPDGRKALYNWMYNSSLAAYEAGDISATELGDKTYYILSKANLSETGGLSVDEASETYKIFKIDNPIFYFLSTSFYTDGDNMYLLVSKDYALESVRRAINAEIAKVVSDYELLTEGLDTCSKIKAVHDRICENMYYSYMDDGVTPSTENWAHNIVGAFVEGKGVCESYAKGFALILNCLDIDNVYITGDSGGRHAWNLVFLDGYYYWVDCTWDDADIIKYDYFLAGNGLWSEHAEDKPDDYETPFLYDLPENISDYSYFMNSVEILKNGKSLGKRGNVRDAFKLLTDCDGEYKLVFNYNQQGYVIPCGVWPDVKSIEFVTESYTFQHLKVVGDITVNSDIILSNVALKTEENYFINSDMHCANLYIGVNDIIIPEGKSGEIGAPMYFKSTQYSGETRTGVNVIGIAGSKIINNSESSFEINANLIDVDTVIGTDFDFNVGKADINILDASEVSFEGDYSIDIKNCYVTSFELPIKSTETRELKIGVLDKHGDDFDSEMTIYNTNGSQMPHISIAQLNVPLSFNFTKWETIESYYDPIINIGKSDISLFSIWSSRTGLYNNFIKLANGDVVRCSHKNEIIENKGKKATFSADGFSEKVICGDCGIVIKKSETVHMVSNVTLESDVFKYTGKTIMPEVVVKDLYGNKLKLNTDYILQGDLSAKDCGVYNIKVVLKGAYSGKKQIEWSILPKATSLSASLTKYNSVKLSWKALKGVDGYRVYYKKSSDTKWLTKDTTKLNMKFAKLETGVKYEFSVIAYVKDSGNKKRFNNDFSKIKKIYTLKKMAAPTITKKKSGKVKVSYKKVSGASGYQISQAASGSKAKIVATITSAKIKSKVISAKNGKNCYYKIRAYRALGGKKVYGQWSKVKEYKLK